MSRIFLTEGLKTCRKQAYFTACRKFSQCIWRYKKSYYLKPNSNTEIDDFRNSTSKSLNFVYIQQAADKSQRYRIMVCCSDNCKILFPDYRGSCKFSLLTFLPPCGIMQLVQTKCRQLYIGYTGHALPYHLC